MATVFISYSHTDSAVADSISQALQELGVDYFRDVKNIELGDPISASVREGLQNASAIIVIISPASLKSQWVAYEVGFGTASNKRVMPFLTHPSLDLPSFMSDLLYAKSIEELSEFFATNPNWHRSSSGAPHQKTTRTATLTDIQVQYLMTISKPRNEGSIWGHIDTQTGREVAPYQEALELFQGLELMRYTGGGYKMTPKGWRLVDQLWALAIVDVLEVDKYANEVDVAGKVGLTDGQTELEELRRHIESLKEKGLVNSTRTSSGVSVALTQQGATYRKHRPVEV